MMRFSCSLPLSDADDNPLMTIEGISRSVKAVDQAKLDAVFVTDHPAPSLKWLENGGHATLDPFVALSVAASASNRLLLHTHILVLAYRNPIVVAKSIASLDRLASGRVVMGIGTGYLKSEYSAVGVSFEQRGAITNEAIEVLRKAWTGEAFSHEGTRFSARDVCVRPRPYQETVPIWAGGNSRPAIRRAVEACEGWSPFPVAGIVSRTANTDELSNISQLAEKIAFAKDHAEKIGRTRPLTVCMSAFSQQVLTPERCPDINMLIDEYSALKEVGVSWTPISLPAPSLAAFEENVHWFGEEIAAKVRS